MVVDTLGKETGGNLSDIQAAYQSAGYPHKQINCMLKLVIKSTLHPSKDHPPSFS